MGLQVQERPCWPVLWQVRQMCHSTTHLAQSSMRCLLVLVPVESETFSVSTYSLHSESQEPKGLSCAYLVNEGLYACIKAVLLHLFSRGS